MRYIKTMIPCPQCGQLMHPYSEVCCRCYRYYQLTKTPCPKCGHLKHSRNTLCFRCSKQKQPVDGCLRCGRGKWREGDLCYRCLKRPSAHHVIESHIGRYLQPGEHVHHINGNHDDDRIDNLQVVSPKEHAEIHNPPITRQRALELATLERNKSAIARQLGVSRQRIHQIFQQARALRSHAEHSPGDRLMPS